MTRGLGLGRHLASGRDYQANDARHDHQGPEGHAKLAAGHLSLLCERCEVPAHIGHSRAENQSSCRKEAVDSLPNRQTENEYTDDL